MEVVSFFLTKEIRSVKAEGQFEQCKPETSFTGGCVPFQCSTLLCF